MVMWKNNPVNKTSTKFKQLNILQSLELKEKRIEIWNPEVISLFLY